MTLSLPRRLALGLAAAFLLQAGLVGWMVVDRALLLSRGTQIRLPVRPVDPRDLVRGEYVRLGYDIGAIETAGLARADRVARGDRAYVSLERQGESWRPIALDAKPPADGLFLRGRVTRAETRGTGQRLAIEYDLEKFFMPEGQAIAVERLRNASRVEVDVAVGRDGRAGLRRLVIDGVLRYEDTLF